MKISNKNTKTETVITSLKEYIRQRRLDEIINEAGKLDFSDDWERLRHER